MIELRSDLQPHFSGTEEQVFERVMMLEGDIYRNLAGRKTLRFTLDGKSFFVKMHRGVGWKEIFKNLIMLRKPVLGARDEWRAIQRLEELGVATMAIAGFGERGANPACRQSFLITDDLTNTVSLEYFCRTWPSVPPPVMLKRALLEKVATIARTLHNNGVNHRDCYICHFLLDKETLKEPFAAKDLTLYLIDLHRVQLRPVTPRRWVEKDVAALYFSSMDIGLTRRDLLRFMKTYRGLPLRRVLEEEGRFWAAVVRKAELLYRNPC